MEASGTGMLGYTGYEGKQHETDEFDIDDRLDDVKFLHSPFVERSPAGGWPMKYALLGEYNPTMSSVIGTKCAPASCSPPRTPRGATSNARGGREGRAHCRAAADVGKLLRVSSHAPPPSLLAMASRLVQDWLRSVLPQGAGPVDRAPAREGRRARLRQGPVGAPHPVRVAQLRHVLQGHGRGGGATEALPSAHALSVVHSECAEARAANGLLDAAEPLGRVAQKGARRRATHTCSVCAQFLPPAWPDFEHCAMCSRLMGGGSPRANIVAARPGVGLHGPRVCAPLRCWR